MNKFNCMVFEEFSPLEHGKLFLVCVFLVCIEEVPVVSCLVCTFTLNSGGSKHGTLGLLSVLFFLFIILLLLFLHCVRRARSFGRVYF